MWIQALIRWLIVGLIFLFVVAVWVVYWYVIKFRIPNWDALGVYGDAFGSLSALFSGLGFAGLIVALYFQQRTLSLQQQEIHDSTEAQKRTEEAQQRTEQALREQAGALKRVAELSELNLRHMLYDKRLAVYNAVRELIYSTDPNLLHGNQFNPREMDKFYARTHVSYFLFGEDVNLYLDNINRKATELIRYQTEIGSKREIGKRSTTPEERNEIEGKRKQLVDWFEQQQSVARDKFSTYLKLTDEDPSKSHG
jgi:uncharacterized membrane protein